MSVPNDGGPAQAQVVVTLRDYFAAATIGQLVVNGYSHKLAVKQAYKCADAMLAERARKEAQP